MVFAVTTFYSLDIKADLVQGHATQPFTQPLHFLISRGLLGNTMLTLDLVQFIFFSFKRLLLVLQFETVPRASRWRRQNPALVCS